MYFGRDRTTVMRWASDSGLPVHRLPNGNRGSIFAFEDELAQWTLNENNGSVLEPTRFGNKNRSFKTIAKLSKLSLISLIPIVGVVGLVIASLPTANRPIPNSEQNATTPTDPAVAADYIQARDLWARRTSDDLNQSIALYESVIRRDPSFAPAYTGLADAWLIYREYGNLSEAEAYARASKAAEKALKLDPSLASAHRAKGFIDYWWHYDARNALTSFQQALAIDPKDGLTHFWYANILSDLGQHKMAQHEYGQAQLLMPGTPAIEVERACADWQAGNDDKAIATLSQLKVKYPADATVRNCLAWAKIGSGNITGYASELRAMALMRNEPNMIKMSKDLDHAIAKAPESAHMILIADARREFASGERQTRMTPAFYASSMGDRETLIILLNEAENLGEKWQSVNLVKRIEKRWKGDAQIAALIAEVRDPATALAAK